MNIMYAYIQMYICIQKCNYPNIFYIYIYFQVYQSKETRKDYYHTVKHDISQGGTLVCN